MKNNELISIIVPIYNVEKYINRCIDSILAQTYQNFEIIIVDDESKDKSIEICEEIAKTDRRIKIIHKKNGGAADARCFGCNYAIKNSDSKWICYIDADDWISKYYLEFLYRSVIDANTKISVCSVRETTEILQEKELEYKYSVENSLDFYVKEHFLGISPCDKLFWKELFINEEFPCGKLFDDILFTHKIMKKVENIAYIDYPLYNYFINTNSVSRSAYSKKYLCGIDAYKSRYEDFLQFGTQKQIDKMFVRYVECIIYNINKLQELGDEESLNIAKKLKAEAKEIVSKSKIISLKKYPGIYLTIGNCFQKLKVKIYCKIKSIVKGR